jgi:ABC-type amino acid transport substrate-binding protein
MKILSLFLLLVNVSLCSAAEPIPVAVGMYPFAPFVEQKGPNGEVGMTIDLIDALNHSQNNYHFETVLIPPKRRYQSYIDGHYDVIFYESKTWGWQDIAVEVSDVYQTGGEVYIALKKEGRGQDYFDDFNNKRMMGILGFHYGFADFDANEILLSKKFNMHLSQDNERNINLLLKGRGDIAVVTKAYLQRYFLAYPKSKELILISEIMDQEYRHTALVRPKIRPNIDEINTMLKQLKSSG